VRADLHVQTKCSSQQRCPEQSVRAFTPKILTHEVLPTGEVTMSSTALQHNGERATFISSSDAEPIIQTEEKQIRNLGSESTYACYINGIIDKQCFQQPPLDRTVFG
jgi:hypothetical protein